METDAKKILAHLKRKRKKYKFKGKTDKQYDRLDFGSGRKVYCNGILMTDTVGDDGIKFSVQLMNKLVLKNKFTQVPCYFEFNENILLGMVKVDGMAIEEGVTKLFASGSVIIPERIYDELSSILYFAPQIKVKKSKRKEEAGKYLAEVVGRYKKFPSHIPMMINSILEAYKNTFGEELSTIDEMKSLQQAGSGACGRVEVGAERTEGRAIHQVILA